MLDTHERSKQLSDAVLRLAGRRGLDAVTFGLVAEEARVSRGLVQHVFGSRERMLEAAAQRLRARADGRFVSEMTTSHRAQPRLLSLLLSLIPADQDAIDEAFAADSLRVLTRRESDLAAIYLRGRSLLLTTVEAELEPSVPPNDRDWQAIALLGSVAHLREAVMLGELTTADARRKLREIVASMTGR